jgi:hypothetical protein
MRVTAFISERIGQFDRWRYKIGETTSPKTYATEALALKAGEKFKREYLPR